MENEVPKKVYKREGSTYGLTQPSRAHKEAIGSVVYRLSELMFGSLLASYVLGFIGFSAPRVSKVFADSDLSVLGPEVATYFFVSMSFAYLTAGLYISYHAGILTMPHLPFSNLRWDFLVALLQAVMFGISMLLPLWFPLCVASVLFAAVLRQRVEYRAFINKLRKALKVGKNQVEHADVDVRAMDAAERREIQEQKKILRNFRGIFSRELDRAPSLKSWWKVSGSTVFGALVLTLVGSAAVVGEWVGLITPDVARPAVPFLAGGVFAVIMWVVNRVLGHRADFMYSDEKKYEIDEQFWHFVDALKGSR